MERKRIVRGVGLVMLAALYINGLSMIPVNHNIVSYAATSSNADRASPEETETVEPESAIQEESTDQEIEDAGVNGDKVGMEENSVNGVYVATDAEQIDISDLEGVTLYGVEQDNTEDNIAVRVPAIIKMESYEVSVDFQIEVSGALNENSVVMVVTDSSVVLESYYKDPIYGEVSQDRSCIEYTDLENGQTSINGNITLDRGVSAGEWRGEFSIEVWIEKREMDSTGFSMITDGASGSIGIATDSNAESVEDTTVPEEIPAETEVVEQPEEIINGNTELENGANDTITSENEDDGTVVDNSESVDNESLADTNTEDSEDDNETDASEVAWDQESEKPETQNPETGDTEVAAPEENLPVETETMAETKGTEESQEVIISEESTASDEVGSVSVENETVENTEELKVIEGDCGTEDVSQSNTEDLIGGNENGIN